MWSCFRRPDFTDCLLFSAARLSLATFDLNVSMLAYTVICETKSCWVYILDMSAAFDTVDHKILLRRLEESFGVRGQALQWLSSFLTDRTQAVAFAGSISTPQMLACGVPQGSVLGPLLFVLYTADVLKIAANMVGHGVCIHAYADDLQTYASCAATDQQTATTCLLACPRHSQMDVVKSA